MKQTILLRSVWGKVGMVYTINPCPEKNGRFCKWVKPIDSKGDMILTDADRNSEDFPYFIPENKEFKVSDGTEFDLSDPYQLAEWEAIKNAPIIASSRYEKDANGNYKIDGDIKDTSNHPRNGVAELYVDIPGVETAARVNKQKLVYDACKLIFDDPKGAEGRLRITRILGKHMKNAPESDVTEYLLDLAKRNPNKIISLYNSNDSQLRLLFIDAKENHVIISKNGIYMYGDTILGATDDAVITWMHEPKNSKLLQMMMEETYPDMYPSKDDKKK